MMSCTASAAWSCPVFSLCCTEPGPSYGAILSSHITTVAMSRSGQLGLHCTVELNCSDMSTRLAGALVTHDRALDTCEPSCVLGVARPFFIPVVHSPLGAVGYVAASELSSREVRSGPHGSTGALLSGRQSPEPWDTWQRRSSPRQGGEVRSYGPRGSTGAYLSKEVRSGAAGHMAALKPTSAGRCGPPLQLTWQCVDARPTPCLVLELVCGGTRSSCC
jgi:hypothetical protein